MGFWCYHTLADEDPLSQQILSPDPQDEWGKCGRVADSWSMPPGSWQLAKLGLPGRNWCAESQGLLKGLPEKFHGIPSTIIPDPSALLHSQHLFAAPVGGVFGTVVRLRSSGMHHPSGGFRPDGPHHCQALHGSDGSRRQARGIIDGKENTGGGSR
jgi:hypothetical protein